MEDLYLLLLLISFLIIFGVIPQYIILKRKKQKEQEAFFQIEGDPQKEGFDTTISPQEQSAKEYIFSYKNQYPRDSIKTALINSGNSSQDVESWLDKYF